MNPRTIDEMIRTNDVSLISVNKIKKDDSLSHTYLNCFILKKKTRMPLITHYTVQMHLIEIILTVTQTFEFSAQKRLLHLPMEALARILELHYVITCTTIIKGKSV